MFLAFNYVNLMSCRVSESVSNGSPSRCRKSQIVRNRIGRWWLLSVNGIELSAPTAVSKSLHWCLIFSMFRFFLFKNRVFCMRNLVPWWKIVHLTKQKIVIFDLKIRPCCKIYVLSGVLRMWDTWCCGHGLSTKSIKIFNENFNFKTLIQNHHVLWCLT